MSVNTWISLGVICGAISLFAVPYGFYLKSQSTQIESLKDDNLTHEDEMAYKAIVSQIFNELKPNAEVRINDSIMGVDSKNNQKIDISIKKETEGQKLLTIVKTYAGKNPIDVPDLNDFYSILNDVRASKGIIISNAGFSDNARHLAPSYGIDLYSIVDAQSKQWKDDIEIPVLYIKLKLNMNFLGTLYLEKGDTLPKNPVLWTISFDGGKTTQPLVDLFISMWNKNENSRVSGTNYTIDVDKDNFFVLVSENKWVRAGEPSLVYNIEQEGFLHYFKPEEYRAIKDHLSGNIAPSTLYMKFKFLKDDTQAIRIDDVDNFKKRTKGVLVILQSHKPKFDQIAEGKVSIQLIDENKP